MNRRSLIAAFALFLALFSMSMDRAYATHDDYVVASTETTGAARGPAFQIYDKRTSALRLTMFVLNADFKQDFQIVQNVRTNGGVVGANAGSAHERILACGRETTGAARGPAFQLFERNGSLVITRFALNGDFTSLSCFSRDVDGDGIHEIILVGNETAGAERGWFAQVWDQSGNVLATIPTLNADFRSSPLVIGMGRDDTGND
jgi:hypothetical protein